MNTLAQVDCFSVIEYVPGGHNVHAEDPVVTAYVPIEQDMHTAVISTGA